MQLQSYTECCGLVLLEEFPRKPDEVEANDIRDNITDMMESPYKYTIKDAEGNDNEDYLGQGFLITLADHQINKEYRRIFKELGLHAIPSYTNPNSGCTIYPFFYSP